MVHFMQFIPFIVIGLIIFSIVSRVNKEQQAAQKRAQQAKVQPRPAEGEQMRTPAGGFEGSPLATSAERERRQEELKRRLIENQARRLAEKTKPSAAPAKPTERRPLEKRVMESSLKKEKPIAEHALDDCGGGSIHDGYHEGVTQFAGKPAASVAGKLGRDLANEDDRIEREHAAAQNAKLVMAKISKLPPLTQGMIYSEILGKPRSETA